MGRGAGCADAEAPARSQVNLLGAFGAPTEVRSVKKRDLKAKRGFVEDIEEWKRQETEWVQSVIDDLAGKVKDFSTSDESWRAYLRSYAAAPDYSILNMLWARGQLSSNEIDEPGHVFSESVWASFGRRVKAEYARPEAKRDRRYGYDQARDWDDRYAVEMFQPLGFNGFYKAKVDAAGNPVLDSKGKAVKEFVPVSPKGFKTFVAYHESATEAIGGGKPDPLPEAPWAGATGSDEDARGLLVALEEKVIPYSGMKISFEEGSSGEADQVIGSSLGDTVADVADRRSAARLSADGKEVIVDKSRPPVDQANDALRVLCQSFDIVHENSDDLDLKRNRAAAESAKYVISSLYGLDAKDQTFPHLAEIGEDEEALRALNSDIHRRVGQVLGKLDPKMKARARAAGERRKKAKKGKKRATKRAAATAGA